MLKEQMDKEYIQLCIDELVDKLMSVGIEYRMIINVLRSYDYNFIE